MGLFGNKARSVIPRAVVDNLAEYGEREFERTQDQNVAPTMAMSQLQIDRSVLAAPDAAAREICRAAEQLGGWSLYGAWTAIHAFLPAGTNLAEYEQTKDESLRFLRGLGLPMTVLRDHMRSDVKLRWQELFPGDF